MTQSPVPGQPYYPQQPSAPSAPAPGQPYPSQQFQAAPTVSAPAPGAGAPGQPYPPQAPDSFFGNLFDTSKGYVERYGRAVLVVAVVAIVVNWLYSGYNAGANHFNSRTYETEFSFSEFVVDLLMRAPWNVTLILLVRLFVELVRSSVRIGARS
ncbi:collagen-like protein [Actinomyces sp. 2119]|uniref:Collagen-like protein n=1 Tax=Actinomyces lilanjuaniae TaxID=2321394 RepID=A0ABM6Z5S4_9ACTO|nr:MULTISPECIES: collagen-like protein [Actinomyces]AYD90564.1 collagen-like protein [Actinomyces lilanjuaniae]RJF43984.1 collagen-like protein [Actinomyces sp. 2119]